MIATEIDLHCTVHSGRVSFYRGVRVNLSQKKSSCQAARSLQRKKPFASNLLFDAKNTTMVTDMGCQPLHTVSFD